MMSTYKGAIRQALREALASDERTLMFGPETQDSMPNRVNDGFSEEFGTDRVRDTPISESAAVGLAVGAAANGYRVIVDIAYADITAVCFSSIVQTAAKFHFLTSGRLRIPVVIKAPIGRYLQNGPMGAQVTASWYSNVSDLNVIMPASPQEAYWSLINALDQPTPSLFLEDRSLADRPGEIGNKNPGLGATVSRTGTDLTLIGAGRAAALAEDAANKLKAVGISADVVSLCYVRPIDRETIRSSVQKTGRAIIIQDEPPNGGYGPVVRCALDELPPEGLRKVPRILASLDQPFPYLIEDSILVSVEDIVSAALDMLAAEQTRGG
jgi:pyruvate/2-oxoglutarate/acetoin dehydrogenase E1 component